jgi:hypothetical protein
MRRDTTTEPGIAVAAPEHGTGLTPRTPLLATTALVIVVSVGAAVTFAAPGVLRGPAVMNGSARGTALTMLVAGLPVLIASVWAARRGSDRAVIMWLGAAGYVVYNAVLLLLATPFNRLFLIYVAMLSLALATLASVAAGIDAPALAARFAPSTPVRGLAVYVWVVVALNTLGYLSRILPAVGSSGPPEFLRGTEMITNPIYVQDLAVWLPLAAVSAAWLWRRRPWGYVTVGAFLAMWVLESLTIAVDQWFGSRADPASPVASSSVVLPFAVFAAISCVPLVLHLRGLPPERA